MTDGQKRGARDALKRSKTRSARRSELQGCWIVFAADDQLGMKTFVQRVQPAIAELEFVGESFFHDQAAVVHVLEGGDLAHVYRPLLEAGVERARFVPHPVRPDDPEHVHLLHISTGSGGSASGSDESVIRLIDVLSGKPDNAVKLRSSGAKERHLFVWLDDDTSYAMSRPLSHASPKWADDASWGLPNVIPGLDPAITHLWIAHERSRLGWLWNGERWQELKYI